MREASVVELHERPSACSPGLALAHLESRFSAWPTRSGGRVIVSVFPVAPGEAGGGLPDYVDCIVIPVAKRGERRVPLAFIPVERDGDRRSAIALGLEQRAQEWHVHLLATSPERRRDLVGELSVSHASATIAACA